MSRLGHAWRVEDREVAKLLIGRKARTHERKPTRSFRVNLPRLHPGPVHGPPQPPQRPTTSAAGRDRYPVAAAERRRAGLARLGAPALRRHLAQLAGSFDVGTTTVYRYIGEAVAVLAEQTPGLATALTSRWRHPVTILDGTLIPSQRVHALPESSRWYSGKHKRYGVNIQALTSGDGSLLWVSDGLPGATHDLTAARQHQIIATAAELGVEVLADKGYQGAGGTTVTPVKGKHLPAAVRGFNTRHARKRARGERGFAILKTWRVLTKLRSDVTAAGDLVRAILVLELGSSTPVGS
jgi:hypothetical protein